MAQERKETEPPYIPQTITIEEPADATAALQPAENKFRIKDTIFLEQLKCTGVEKIIADVIFRLLPYLTPPGTEKSASHQTINMWRSFDEEISDIGHCSALQATYLKIIEAKDVVKELIKGNKAAEAKLRMENDGIYDLLRLHQNHLEKGRKNASSFPQNNPPAVQPQSTDAKQPDDADRILQIDDSSLQRWLTSS